MNVDGTDIPGLFRIGSRLVEDERGSFMKTLHASAMAAAGLRTDWKEAYCTASGRGVVRGMHFQTPPADHAKLVFCLTGAVLDVVLDLRHGSPTEGQCRSFHLSKAQGEGLYIPSGCAHGFLSLTDESLLLYQVTSVHSPDYDRGVAWDSFGFDWGVASPLLSPRDQSHPPLADFVTPFRFDPGAPQR